MQPNQNLNEEFMDTYSDGEGGFVKAPENASQVTINKAIKNKKIAQPKAKVNPNAPLAPGKFKTLDVPNIPLSPNAEKFLPDPEAQAKADILKKKIAAFEKEIERLNAEANKASQAKQKAINAREKIAGIDPQVLKYFSYIEHHCSEFLAAAQPVRKLLYRGQDDNSKPIFVGRPRDDRTPKDSDRGAQKMLDLHLTLLGFKALRSNSIFATSDIDFASGYGEEYAIFPKNGFSFTWSRKEADIVLHDIRELGGTSPEDVHEDLMSHVFDEYEADWLTSLIDLKDAIAGIYDLDEYSKEDKALINSKATEMRSHPAFKNLKTAMNTWHNKIDYDDNTIKEIKTAFVKYAEAALAFSKTFPKFNKAYNISDKNTAKELAKIKASLTNPASDKEEAEQVIKYFGFKKDDLAAALKSGHEICINGEYVAVSVDEYRTELLQFFVPPKVKTPK